MSRGLGRQERRLLDEMEKNSGEVFVSVIAKDRADSEALKRAARSLERKELAGIIYLSVGAKRRMVVTTVERAATQRAKEKEDRLIDAKLDYLLAEQKYFQLKGEIENK